MTVTGLLFIIAAWSIECYRLVKHDKKINEGFLALYIIGVFLLVMDGFTSGPSLVSVLNLISLGLSTFVYVYVLHKSNKDKSLLHSLPFIRKPKNKNFSPDMVMHYLILALLVLLILISVKLFTPPNAHTEAFWPFSTYSSY
ncbi:MAG: hypothetical protein M3Q44_00610 [bacterium]|nr:hypothetical protein [bacterium]